MTADIAARLAAAGVRVKPLEWEYIERRGIWIASDVFSGVTYTVSDSQWIRGEICAWVDGGDDAAKSAAQADYTARILAALEVV